jgi:hypothetical protein
LKWNRGRLQLADSRRTHIQSRIVNPTALPMTPHTLRDRACQRRRNQHTLGKRFPANLLVPMCLHLSVKENHRLAAGV